MPGMKLGLDFGSTTLTVYAQGRGIVLSELSAVICDKYSMRPIAMGNAAKSMLEKLPASMVCIYPIRGGIINNYPIAKIMLKRYLDKVCAGRLLKPTVLMGVPSNVSELEKKTLLDLVTEAGAGRACFIEEALAAAVGSGVSLTEPRGTFICDIGGETTDCAVVTMGNIAVSKSVRVGGNQLSNRISEYIFREHNIEVGGDTADKIKKTVGTAVYRNEEIGVIAGGKNCDTGMPVLFEITSTEIYWILKSYMEDILGCIRSVLEITPPELISDIADTGIILSGGSANLFGIDRFIEWNTGIRTVKADRPGQCAALGLGRLLQNRKSLENNGYVYISPEDEAEDEEL
ncbi:MAG: rod shape-determining protein [Clostridia bacterium]|nr:rod shape-determining protein [Clostridia bacterium]MBR5423770.1 rod shape-determining protein [Clostridia bacterium]